MTLTNLQLHLIVIIPIRFPPSCFVFPKVLFISNSAHTRTYWSSGHTAGKLRFSTLLPQIVPFVFLCPPFWILRGVTAVHLFPDSRSPFPIPDISNIRVTAGEPGELSSTITEFFDRLTMWVIVGESWWYLRENQLSPTIMRRLTRALKLNFCK